MSAPYTLSSSLISPAACGPGVAFFWCVLVLGLGLGSVIVFLFLRLLVLRRAQEHEHALLHDGAAKPLSAGPGRVVFGRVEVDGTEDVALAIDIAQRVQDRREKNSTSHVWNEVSRSVRASPFYLVRDDGVSVYVEPSEGALVVDVLETSYPIDTPLERVRRADVRRGEQFYAYGDLVAGAHPRAEGAYRDGVGWILKTPRTGRMLLATEGIRERYRPRISFLRGAAIGLTLAFCLLHGLFTLPFVVASLVGEHATAEVTQMRTYVTHGKHGPITHYALDVRTEDGVVMDGEVPRAAYEEARRARAS